MQKASLKLFELAYKKVCDVIIITKKSLLSFSPTPPQMASEKEGSDGSSTNSSQENTTDGEATEAKDDKK